MRRLEAALKLTIFLSCLGVTVLGHPPFLEETPGVVTIVGVKGIRQRVRCGNSRCGGRRLAYPGRKWPDVVIEDEPTDALVDDSCYGRERLVLPHAAEPLADRDLLL